VWAARFLTQCIGLAADEATKSDYARRAVNQLDNAAKRGLLRSPDVLERFQDLAPLRDREDFQKLRDRLKNGGKVGVT
jgi:hypothetical protein